MGRQRFVPGVRLLLDEQMVIIREVLADGRCRLENLSLGGQRFMSQDELCAAWAEGRLRFEVVGRGAYDDPDRPLAVTYTQADFQALPERQRAAAWARYQHLTALFQSTGHAHWVRLSRRDIRAYVQHQADLSTEIPSTASLERWMNAFLDSGGDIRALVPHSHRQGGRERSRLQPEVEHIIQAVLADCADNPRHRTPDQVYTRILNQIADANATRPPDDLLSPPSRATLYRRLEQAGLQAVLRRKPSRSERQAASDSAPGPQVNRILERVEIDHTPLHLFVVDFEDRLPIGRPTLTLATDVYSKMPFGFDVSFQPASYLTVMRCLRHGILPKPDCQATYGTVNPFPVYGLPETVVVDQGREFVGHSLTDALGMLGIIREVMPGRTPWYKGSVERFFRTQNQGLLEGLPGYTFGNIFARADYDPQQDACISLTAFHQMLYLFLVDVYAQSWHEGIQDIPARRWDASLREGMLPCLYHDAEELRIILCASDERTLTRQGIEWETLYYHSPELGRRRTATGGERVRFRYDPDDIGQIYVYDPFEGGHWLTVPAVDQAYTRGLSLYKHRVIRHAVLNDKRRVDIYALAEAKARLQDLVAHEFALTRKARGRKQAARFLGVDVNEPPTPPPVVSSSPMVLPPDTPLPPADDWGGDYDLPVDMA
jgi:putative transposase